jgi:hypothetical protein
MKTKKVTTVKNTKTGKTVTVSRPVTTTPKGKKARRYA